MMLVDPFRMVVVPPSAVAPYVMLVPIAVDGAPLGGTPRPIRDDGARPIRGGVRATSARRAMRDARPNHRNLAHVRPPAQPRRRLSGQRRRILFEVSFPVPPG